MKVVIVQLSDVHLSVEKWPDNPVLGRADKVLAAVASLFVDAHTCCLLLINGDLAYQGLEAEYDLAATFFGQVRDGLRGLYGAEKCHSVVLPGNHDCNFSNDNNARRSLIADAKLEAFGDGSIIDICTKVQDNFFDFCASFQGHSNPITGIDRIFSEHQFAIGTEELVVRVLNSAWCSQTKEKAGTLVMPSGVLKPYLDLNGSAKLVVTAIHHPYGWMEPNNARAIRQLIESSSDLIFTGHEHVAESFSKTGYLDEHNEYIEAGPLQENGSPGNSEFTVIIVDTDRDAYVVNHFAWTGDMYELVNEPAERPFIRNNSRLQGEFELNDQFRSELVDTDTAYQHPFKDNVSLDDIFVYPDLREFSPVANPRESKGPATAQRSDPAQWQGKADLAPAHPPRRTVKGREIVDYILGKKHVVISAPDRAGKTALSRVLFRDLWRNGKIPLLLNGEHLDSRVASQFGRHLDQAFLHQYRSPKPAKY